MLPANRCPKKGQAQRITRPLGVYFCATVLADPYSHDVSQHVHGVLGPSRLIAEAGPELAALWF